MRVKRDERFYFDDLGTERFDRLMSDYDVERRLHLVFDRLLGEVDLEGRLVLEVGSGTGRFSRAIVKAGGRLVACDLGRTLVADVTRRCGCRGVAGDALALPFSDGVFDLVLSSECIEHTPDPERALREMCRVCRPGGTVCVTTPNRLWYPVLVAAQRLGLRGFAGPERWISPARAAAVLRQEGMQDVHLDGCHLWPFQLAPTRPLLRRVDELGRVLHPWMINFGVRARKG